MTFQSFKGLKSRIRKPDLSSELLSSKCLEISSLPRADHSPCSALISICFWFLAPCSGETAALSLLEENVHADSILTASYFCLLLRVENTQGHIATRSKEHLLAFSLGLSGEAQGFALQGWGVSTEAR